MEGDGDWGDMYATDGDVVAGVLESNDMTHEDRKLLESTGWTVVREWPECELRHKDGSVATGTAAAIVLSWKAYRKAMYERAAEQLRK